MVHPQPYSPAEADLIKFARRLGELRQALAPSDPGRLATDSGARCTPTPDGGAIFDLPLWGQPVQISFPALVATDAATGQELPAFLQALLLYYLHNADGLPQVGRWISFADLPDGRFYNPAFQGYTGKELVRAFGNDLQAFTTAALALGGEAQTEPGDQAFAFHPLPRVTLLVAYWLGDEDFPPSCQVLFDASVSHYLPTDGCAVLGGNLARRLIKQK